MVCSIFEMCVQCTCWCALCYITFIDISSGNIFIRRTNIYENGVHRAQTQAHPLTRTQKHSTSNDMLLSKRNWIFMNHCDTHSDDKYI